MPQLPFPIGAALLACFSFPIVLLLLSQKPFIGVSPGRRFAIAWGLVIIGWTCACAAMTDIGVDGLKLADFVAGLMLFGAGVLCSFMLWSVLCWGFTLNMLVALARAKCVGSLAEWQTCYAGEMGLRQLAVDRAEVLLRAGLVRLDGSGNLHPTSLGRSAIQILRFLSTLLAVDR
jgi:hypothetical protein